MDDDENEGSESPESPTNQPHSCNEKKRKIKVFFRNKFISIDDTPNMKNKLNLMLSKQTKASSKYLNPIHTTLSSSKSSNYLLHK